MSLNSRTSFVHHTNIADDAIASQNVSKSRTSVARHTNIADDAIAFQNVAKSRTSVERHAPIADDVIESQNIAKSRTSVALHAPIADYDNVSQRVTKSRTSIARHAPIVNDVIIYQNSAESRTSIPCHAPNVDEVILSQTNSIITPSLHLQSSTSPSTSVSQPPSNKIQPNDVCIQEPIDKFIDNLVEGQESTLDDSKTVTTSTILRWEYESRNLPTIDLHRFDGTPSKWPDFVENFKTRVHLKVTFDDNTRMERLLSVLDGEAKRSIQSIGSNGIFYAIALKTLKRDFGNPVVVAQSKLKSVLDLPQLPSNDRTSLRRYHQQLKSTITWLKSMGYNTAIYYLENLTKAVTRLPNYLRNQFYITSKDKILTDGGIYLTDLEKWLDSKLKEQFNPIACLIAEKEKSDKKNKSNTEGKTRNFAMYNKQNNLKCWICTENHKVSDCKGFTEKPIESRRKIVAEKGLCYNCLSSNHKIKECKSKKTCAESSCGKRHHTLLHLPSSQSREKVEPNDKAAVNNNTSDSEHTYLQIVPVTLFNGEMTVQTNAMLDSGSDSTLIRNDVAVKLGLDGTDKSLQVSNILSNSKKINSEVVNFEISSNTTEKKTIIKNAWAVNNLNIPIQKRNVNELKRKYKHLRDLDIATLNRKDVTVLIGMDVPLLHLHHDARVGKDDEPIAVLTELGWVVCGNKRNNSNGRFINHIHIETDDVQINKTLEKFWQIDSYPTLPSLHPNLLTVDENRAITILNSTTKKTGSHF